MEVFQKRILHQEPAITLLDICPKDAPLSHKNNCSSMSAVFIAALFIISRNRKQPSWPSSEEWIKKMWYTYTTEYCSAVKNQDIINFARQMYETGEYHPEQGNPDSKGCTWCILTYKWILTLKYRIPMVCSTEAKEEERYKRKHLNLI